MTLADARGATRKIALLLAQHWPGLSLFVFLRRRHRRLFHHWFESTIDEFFLKHQLAADGDGLVFAVATWLSWRWCSSMDCKRIDGCSIAVPRGTLDHGGPLM